MCVPRDCRVSYMQAELMSRWSTLCILPHSLWRNTLLREDGSLVLRAPALNATRTRRAGR